MEASAPSGNRTKTHQNGMGRGAQTHARLRAELYARQSSRTEIEEGEIDETVEASAPS